MTSPDRHSCLYVACCRDGSPCNEDLAAGGSSSSPLLAGRPLWNRKEAENTIRRLDAKTPEEAGLNVSRDKWEKFFKADCGPHSIAEYRIQSTQA